jgi:hypothetical protein
MHEHAVTDALTVSFQRYPYPPSGWVETLPRSRGALPLALATPDHLLLACPAGEAFWIGLVATGGRERSSRVGAVARLASGERVDLATGTAPAPAPTGTAQLPASGAAPPPPGGATPAGGLPRPGFEVPPRFAVEGIARQDGGWWALALAASGPAAPACVGLELAVWTGPAAAPERRGGPSPLHDPTHPAGRPPPPPGGVPPARPDGGPGPPPAPVSGGPPVLVRVDVVDAAGFEAATGRRVPGPVGDDAGYGGWRLP